MYMLGAALKYYKSSSKNSKQPFSMSNTVTTLSLKILAQRSLLRLLMKPTEEAYLGLTADTLAVRLRKTLPDGT